MTHANPLFRILSISLACLLGSAARAGAAGKPAAPVPTVAVVYGELSVRPSDLGYSRAMARNLSRWLEDAGLTPAVFSDTRTTEALAAPRVVAHLVNIDDPPREVLAAIDAFLARGGKLVVFNSSSQRLADRMGLKVGRYRTAPVFGAWAQFRFTDKAPLHAPRVVRQSSSALREVFPSDPSSRVAAWWEDREGLRTPYAAWLQHPNGFWMTHVLLEDEDGESRRHLLASITGACAAPTWRVASDALYARLGPTVGAADYSSAVARLRQEAPPERRPALESILREADTLHAAVVSDRRRGLHAAATARLWSLRTLLIEAYAVLQSPWPGSVRAVWDHDGFGFFLGDWDATCQLLARYGITDLFLLVATPTSSHAAIPGLEASPLRQEYGDQLAAALKAGKRHKVRVHAWISVLNPMHASRQELAVLEQQGRLLFNREGKVQPWLDPRHPENQRWLRQTARHLAREYAIDGIHLDYIRFPDLQAGLGGGTRADFERRSGKPVTEWPRDVLYPSRPRHRDYIVYRTEQISALVGSVRAELRSTRPGAKLSAAVYGRHPLCVDSVGQDWVDWLRKGILDWAAPMNYTDTPSLYKSFLDDQAADPALRGRILSGIGVTAAECTLNAVQVIDQVKAARVRGLGGYVLFDLDATLRLEVLPFLRLGINRPVAEP